MVVVVIKEDHNRVVGNGVPSRNIGVIKWVLSY